MCNFAAILFWGRWINVKPSKTDRRKVNSNAVKTSSQLCRSLLFLIRMCSTSSQEFCTGSRLCCGHIISSLVVVDFTHILQSYFTGTWAMIAQVLVNQPWCISLDNVYFIGYIYIHICISYRLYRISHNLYYVWYGQDNVRSFTMTKILHYKSMG